MVYAGSSASCLWMAARAAACQAANILQKHTEESDIVRCDSMHTVSQHTVSTQQWRLQSWLHSPRNCSLVTNPKERLPALRRHESLCTAVAVPYAWCQVGLCSEQLMPAGSDTMLADQPHTHRSSQGWGARQLPTGHTRALLLLGISTCQ